MEVGNEVYELAVIGLLQQAAATTRSDARSASASGQEIMIAIAEKLEAEAGFRKRRLQGERTS